MSINIFSGKPPIHKPISLSLGLSYSLPIITTAFLTGALAVVQGIYSKYFGLPLSTIASILLLARVFDAVSDPLIGFYCDRYHARTGSRKPFILCGGLLLVISSYFLFIPVDLGKLSTLGSDTEPTSVSAGYFLTWFIVFYFAWTLFEIPHLAWATEITNSSQEKSYIYSLRVATSWLGVLFFYAVPLLPIFETREFTPHSLSFSVIFAGSLMLLLLFICLKFTPNGYEIRPKKDTRKCSDITIMARGKVFVYEIMANKPLLLFMAAFMASSIALTGMWFTLLFIYVDAYLELGDQFAQASLIALLVGLLMIGVWYAVTTRLGKKVTLALGLLFSGIGIVLTGFLAPNESGFLSLLLVMIFSYGIGITAIGALAPSLLADIIDYSHWKFGSDRSATYFSLFMMVSKMAVAIGGAIGLGIAGHYGFDPAADTYTTENITGLRLAIAWLPAGFVLCAMILFLVNPLTARRHALVRNRLEARDRRAVQRANIQPFIEPKSSDNKSAQHNDLSNSLNIAKS